MHILKPRAKSGPHERRQEEKGERAPREGEMRCRSSEKTNQGRLEWIDLIHLVKMFLASNVRSTFISELYNKASKANF